MATTTAGRKTKLTCPSPTTGARGLPRFHHRRRGTVRQPRDPLHSLAKPNGKAQVVPFAFPYTNVYPKGRQAYSLLLQTTMEAPATWTLVLFQQAIDRQDRTQTEGRFSLLEPLEIQQPSQESLPLPDKDSSHDADDMPCRHPSIDGYSCSCCYRNDETPSRKPTPRRRQTLHRT